jgi:hypothetical protein
LFSDFTISSVLASHDSDWIFALCGILQLVCERRSI